MPIAAFGACGELPSSRTVTSAIELPAGADAVPATVMEVPLAVAEPIEMDGGGVSAKGWARKKAHSRSVALGPVGLANSPLLSPTQ